MWANLPAAWLVKTVPPAARSVASAAAAMAQDSAITPGEVKASAARAAGGATPYPCGLGEATPVATAVAAAVPSPSAPDSPAAFEAAVRAGDCSSAGGSHGPEPRHGRACGFAWSRTKTEVNLTKTGLEQKRAMGHTRLQPAVKHHQEDVLSAGH